MKCCVVTPEATVVDKDARFVVAPLYDGEYGVAENHAPVVGRLGAGELRMTLLDGTIERWYVEGGFLEVLDNNVSLLTNRAVRLETLDVATSREALARAQAITSNSDESAEVKEAAVLLARAQLRAAQKGALVKK
ncbi:MAG: ATP synthase F1 subunit epsilon [Thermoguttaceae bacterium]|nr:ATP synthase F1 subunit epsilon [Thermoguttaceae bacterium]